MQPSDIADGGAPGGSGLLAWRGVRVGGYALCNVAMSVGALALNLFLLYYLTEVRNVPASLAGLAVALPKVWDALIDPMFGGWIDRLAVRLRRRYPIVIVAGVIYACSLFGVFALPATLAMWQIVTLTVVLLIASSVAHTGIGVSQFAIATEMTGGTVDLSRLLAIAAISAQVLTVPAGAVLPLIIANAGSGAHAYAVMGMQVAAFCTAALALFIVATRRVAVRPTTADTAGLGTWASLRATAANKSFYQLVALVVCLNGSITIQMGFLPFANKYVLAGSAGTLSLFQSTLGLSVVAGMVSSPFLARRYGAIPSMRACNLLSVAALIGMFAASYLSAPWTVCAFALAGFGAGVIGVLIQTAILNAARLPLRIGVAVALGFYLGIMVAAIKLGGSAGSLISGQLLNVIGFRSGGGVQSAETLLGLRLCYTLVPCLLTLAGSWFLFRTRLADELRG